MNQKKLSVVFIKITEIDSGLKKSSGYLWHAEGFPSDVLNSVYACYFYINK